LDAAITDARALAARAGTGNHQITYLEDRRQDLVDQITGRHTKDSLMALGPDPAGNLYEIGVVGSDEGTLIVHAMRARLKYRK
jgi:hypothetical protein